METWEGACLRSELDFASASRVQAPAHALGTVAVFHAGLARENLPVSSCKRPPITMLFFALAPLTLDMGQNTSDLPELARYQALLSADARLAHAWAACTRSPLPCAAPVAASRSIARLSMPG